MKKIIWTVLILLVLGGAVAAWIFLGPATGFKEKTEFLYIRSNAATKAAVMDSISKNKIVSNTSAFEFLANRMNYWDGIKPGKYEIKKGTSLLDIVRKLRNGQQTPVNLVITKYRLKEDLAKTAGSKFEFDDAEMLAFLNSGDSLKDFNVTPETAMWLILPDTYQYFWNTTPRKVYTKLHDESQKFWTAERKKKAQDLGLTPLQVYIIASIIEEETTNHAEKDTIASVYINRYKIGMPLQADPTVKYAVRNFAAKRVAGEMLNSNSPYNTYRVKGLPPGPICTPTKLTIDKVLNAANTNYLYFVAHPKLRGHLFSTTYDEHLRKRADYLAADKLRREQQNGAK
jgi:UPF0755 protein